MIGAWPVHTLSLVAGPTVEPITVEDVKDQIRITTDEEKDLLERLIVAAREYAEAFTERALMTQMWDLWLDRFPVEPWIVVPRAPLMSVDSFAVRQVDGSQVEWDRVNWRVEAPFGPVAQRGRIIKAPGVAWPVVTGEPGSIAIRFMAGYGDFPHDVPAAIKVAMLEFVADGWQQRGNLVYGTVATAHEREQLLWPFKAYG